jgi:hypothetical protein
MHHRQIIDRFRLDCRGQYTPLAAMVIFTVVISLIAVGNIFRVAKAKLEAQNLADAAALAIAAMEAKSLNTVVDRNEWLNHMYSERNTKRGNFELPNISQADKWNPGDGGKWADDLKKSYARLVRTVNQAQDLFATAYNNFLGATNPGSNGMPSQNSGAGSLADILLEIHGLSQPGVRIVIWNNDADASAAEADKDTFMSEKSRLNEPVNQPMISAHMQAMQYETVDIMIQGKEPLCKALGSCAEKIGWKRLKTNDPHSSLSIKTKADGNAQPQIGVGVYVIKQVPRLGMATPTTVYAKSYAYVVRESGLSGLGGTSTKPPEKFRPTYYVQLGAK